MDKIFGGSGVGSAPPGTFVCTPLFPSRTQSSTAEQQHTEDQQAGPSTSSQTTRDTKTPQKEQWLASLQSQL